MSFEPLKTLNFSLIKSVKVLLALAVLMTSVGAFAQNRSNSVKITTSNPSLKTVFSEVEKQTGYITMFSNDELDMYKTVTLTKQDYTLNELYSFILKGLNVEYEITKDYIVIRPQGNKPKTPLKKLFSVSGRVVDKNDQPLVGVHIIRKNSRSNATITNNSGEFKLQITETEEDAPYTLVFSYIGMEKYEETLTGGKNNLAVELEETANEIEEVVVNGYQTVNRKDMVGSYTAVKVKDIAMPTAVSVDQLLQGQVAGMVVTNSSARAGATSNISIRGSSTILGNKSPLWVVDGIIQTDVSKPGGSGTVSSLISSGVGENVFSEIVGNQISWLNPNDIESITVLKDASATALYGSKASNGVIVVTTKKGKNEKISVNYSSNYSLSMRPTYNNYYLMNSQERINFSKEAYEAGAYYQEVPLKQIDTYEGLMRMYLESDIDEDFFVSRYKYLETLNTDWLSLLTRNGFSQNQFLSFSGGNSKSSFVASLSYNSVEGIEKGNNSNRFSGRINSRFELNKKMRLDFSLMGSSSQTLGYAAGVNPQSYAISTSRNIPVYKEDGSLNYYYKNDYYKYNTNTQQTGLHYNILNEIENTYSTTNNPQVDASLNFNWELSKLFTYQLTAGYKQSMRSSEALADQNSFYITKNLRGYDYGTVDPGSAEFQAALLPFGGQLISDYRYTKSYNIQNKLLISKTFNKIHRLNAMAAWEVSSTRNLGKHNTVWGFLSSSGEKLASPTPLNNIVPIGTGYGTDGWGVFEELYNGRWSSTNTTDNFVSAFATAAYSFKDRYVFNVNFRNDISNRFGQDVNKRFDPTYSFGAAWRIMEEKFAEKFTKVLDQLTMKATFGIQGNALTNVSPEMILYGATASTVYNQYTSGVSQLMNPYLSWERTKTWNFGLDIGLKNKLVSATFEYYGRNSNAINNVRLLQEYGYSGNVPMNGTHIANHGLEGTINLLPVKSKTLNVIMGINLSKNWNAVTKIVTNPNQTITTNNYISGNGYKNILLETGYPVGAFWVYDFAGLDPNTGNPTFDFHPEKGTKYTDFLVYGGNKNAAVTGGLNLRVIYKKVSLVTYFAAIMGSKTLLPNPYQNFESGSLPDPEYNLSKLLIERWKNPGDETHTNIPSVYSVGSSALNIVDPSGISKSMYDMWAQSTAQLVDGSFLRCRQISIDWMIKPKFFTKLGVRNATLSATVNNIFVLANKRFRGMDPELGTSIMPKTYSFGLNIGF